MNRGATAMRVRHSRLGSIAMPAATWLFAATALLVAAGPAFAREAVVTFAPGIGYAVNGVEEIQPVMGVAVNGESRMQHVEETRALDLPSSRVYLWVEGDGCSLGRIDDRFVAADFDAMMPRWFDAALSIDPATGKRVPGGIHPHFHQLEQLVAWGATENVVLQIGQPHPRTEADFPAIGRFFRAVLREVKRRFPELRVRCVMLFNEPDFEYPRPWEKRSVEESIAFFYALHRAVQADVAREFPDVAIVSPGISGFLCYAGEKLWTVPYLEQVPDAAYCNAQPYTRRSEDLLAWAGSLQAASLAIKGRRTPLVITEHNVDIHQSGDEWWRHEHHVDRVRDEADILFEMFRRPDQFHIKTYFYYHYTCNWHDMWFRHDGVTEPSPVYWLWWTLRDVRGKRVFADVAAEADGALMTIGSARGRSATLALFNSAAGPLAARVETLLPRRVRPNSVVEDALCYDPESRRFLNTTKELGRAPERVELAPGEVRKLCLSFDREIAGPGPALGETELFAARRGVLVGRAAERVDIESRAPARGEQVFLRAAFTIDDVLAINRLRWSVNGRRMSLPLTEGEPQTVLYVERALPEAVVAGRTRIDFAPCPEASYRVLFASVVYRPRPADAPQYTLRPSDDDLAPGEIALHLPASVFPGEAELVLTLTNLRDAPLAGVPRFELPPGWTLRAPPGRVEVGPNARERVALALTIPPGQLRGAQFVSASLDAGAGAGAGAALRARRGTVYQPDVVAQYAATPPAVDGKLDEWDAGAFAMKHADPVPHDTRARFAWDERAFYVAVEVEGRPIAAVPAGTPPWNFDTAELFFDFANARKPQRSHRTMQVYVPLREQATGRPTWANVPNDPNGAFLAHTKPETYRVAVVESPKGFVLEAAFDWKTMTTNAWTTPADAFEPRAGLDIGFEAALGGRALVRGRTKNHADPSQWGVLRFVKGEEGRRSPGGRRIALDFTERLPASVEVHGDSTIEDGALALKSGRGTFSGQLLLLKDELPSPMTPEGLTTTFVVDGFRRQKGEPPLEEQFVHGARIFWTPRIAPGQFAEPYVIPGPLVFLYMVHRDGSPATSISLSCKREGDHDGFGAGLWGGSVSNESFPLTVTLWLNEENYRLTFDKHVETAGGSVSGKHGLEPGAWSRGMRFGIRSVAESNHSGVVPIRRVDAHGGRP